MWAGGEWVTAVGLLTTWAPLPYLQYSGRRVVFRRTGSDFRTMEGTRESSVPLSSGTFFSVSNKSIPQRETYLSPVERTKRQVSGDELFGAVIGQPHHKVLTIFIQLESVFEIFKILCISQFNFDYLKYLVFRVLHAM